MDPIKVLIVDDSALMRNLIRKMLEDDEEIMISSVAINGIFALRKTEALQPDVIILDLEMPKLDGIGFLNERQRRGWSVPVIILSALAKKGAAITMQALALGASDFITKPTGSEPDEIQKTASHLISMIKALGAEYRKKNKGLGVPGILGTQSVSGTARPLDIHGGKTFKMTPPPMRKPSAGWPLLKPKQPPTAPKIIVIGISTGGPNALRYMFANLSPALTVPIVVVQHMPAGFTAEFASSLSRVCPLEVKEAADGDLIKPGRILIAPGDKHITVKRKHLGTVIQTVGGEKVNGHMPSVGVLFESVAKEYSNASMAIIMTGMGKDGSRAIGDIYAEGGTTLAQDEASSVIYGMPKVAVDHGYISQVTDLDGITSAINKLAES